MMPSHPDNAHEFAAHRLLSAATLEKHYDIVVIGAGPAGALLSMQAARAGLKVLNVEKSELPRYKVCGCCLSCSSLRALESCGLGDLATQLGASELCRLTVCTDKRKLDIPLPRFRSLSRSQLDMALIARAIKDGAACLPSATAKVLPASSGDEQIEVELSLPDTTLKVQSQLVVAADGLGGTSLAAYRDLSPVVCSGSRIGVGAISNQASDFYRPGTIYMACAEEGYSGLVRLEDGSADIAAALNTDYLRAFASPAEAIGALLSRCSLPVPDDLAQLPFKGTVALTRRRPRVAAHRVFVIGDAAGYVEPFTGEGIAWALESALCLAPLAVAAVRHWDESCIWRWQHLYRRNIQSRQRTTKLVAGLLRHPPLANAAVDMMSGLPYAAGVVSKLVSGCDRTEERLWLPS